MGRVGAGHAATEWAATRHQIVVGAALDYGTTSFAQSAQPATFVDDRDTVGIGAFEPQTAVTSTNRYSGVYVADTIALDRQWNVTLSGRYNRARITTTDRSGEAPAIDGTNTYRRFNPAAGATWTQQRRLNVFGGASQGMRVPSPVELTCADPNAPCTLPNIFVADPPLQPVRATTYELGTRGRVGADRSTAPLSTAPTLPTISSSSAPEAAPSMPDISRTSAERVGKASN